MISFSTSCFPLGSFPPSLLRGSWRSWIPAGTFHSLLMRNSCTLSLETEPRSPRGAGEGLCLGLREKGWSGSRPTRGSGAELGESEPGWCQGMGIHPLPTSPSPILAVMSTAGREQPPHCQNPAPGAAGVVSCSWTMGSAFPQLLGLAGSSFWAGPGNPRWSQKQIQECGGKQGREDFTSMSLRVIFPPASALSKQSPVPRALPPSCCA